VDQQQQSRWWLWMGISAVGLFAAIVVFGGYYFEWKWTGFPKRTPWDWVDLLIVPLVLALGGYLFNRSENRATRGAAKQRARDEALQAYLDQMGQMLLDKERHCASLKGGRGAYLAYLGAGVDGARGLISLVNEVDPLLRLSASWVN
jgi:hypothetical protein